MRRKTKSIANIKSQMVDAEHVFTKHNWVTEQDVEDFESLIYNDRSILPKIIENVPQIDTLWIESVLVEDEQWKVLPEPFDSYILTSFGRIFNFGSRRQIVITTIFGQWGWRNKGVQIKFNKEFVENGWIFSKSLLQQKYAKYGWKSYSGKIDK